MISSIKQHPDFAKAYHFVYVDYDTPLGRQLFRGGSVPQFQNKTSVWNYKGDFQYWATKGE